MNKRLTIYLIILLLIIMTIFILLITLKIDYYKMIPFEIKEDYVIVKLESEPQTIFVNVNNHVTEVHSWANLSHDTYVLDFNVNKGINDKVFCYEKAYKLNYLSYIFKIVFNI